MEPTQPQIDSPAWIFFTWASFTLAIFATSLGIWWLPVDVWIRAFLGMGLLFTIGSSISLSKTIRDQHEARKYANKSDKRSWYVQQQDVPKAGA